jgi:DNA repair exonuclease SbcCD ATPase subunit
MPSSPSSAIWLRPEYQGRENELETRETFEKRTGISVQSLSSMFTRYANRVPKVVKKFGKLKFFVATELDDFVQWINENSGNRTEVEVREAELARVEKALDEASGRVEDRKRDLERAEQTLAKFRRQARGLESDIQFLKQVQ